MYARLPSAWEIKLGVEEVAQNVELQEQLSRQIQVKSWIESRFQVIKSQHQTDINLFDFF